MITGFNHTSFTVADIDLAVRFWTKTLGFELASLAERRGDWQGPVTGIAGARLRVAHLFGYGHHMEFIQYLAAPGPERSLQPNMAGVAHVCLEVDDIHATAEIVLEQGGSAQGEMVYVDEGAVAGCWAGYIRDPNGIIIELLQLPAAASSAESPQPQSKG